MAESVPNFYTSQNPLISKGFSRLAPVQSVPLDQQSVHGPASFAGFGSEAGAGAYRAVLGSWHQNVLPEPGSLATPMLPFWASAANLQNARPNPVEAQVLPYGWCRTANFSNMSD